MEISKKLYYPFVIETDLQSDIKEFKEEMSQGEWVDSNLLYKDYVSKATSGKQMEKFYVKEIHKMTKPNLRLVANIFKQFKIKSNEFRCDFFKVLPGGQLPEHIDQKSKISFCLPLVKNTGFTYFRNGEVKLSLKYQSMIVLNNLELHGVESPTEERILFRIGVHDISFDEMVNRNFGLREKFNQTSTMVQQ